MQKDPAAIMLKVQNGRAVCPVCKRETPVRILTTTCLDDFPLFCKRCGQTTIVKYRKPKPLSLS